MSKNKTKSRLPEITPEKLVAWCFEQHGYARIPNPNYRGKNSKQTYKKGYEIRFSLADEDELNQLRNALEALSFQLGSPFQKARRLIQPIYGKTACLRLSRLIQETLQEEYHPLEIASQRMVLRNEMVDFQAPQTSIRSR